ncbi:MAG: AAA family ATPase [bacterium]
MDKLDGYLQEYKEVADTWLKETEGVVKKHYDFFQSFFKKEKLEKIEWEDVQQIGNNIHAFNSLALAKKRAVGRPNHPIEHYKKVFIYLLNGKDPLEVRVSKIFSDKEYEILGFGKGSLSEILANVFADDFVLFNSRDIFALHLFGIPVNLSSNDHAKNFLDFNEAVSPVRERYLRVIGQRTLLPLNLELDQFFSYLNKKYDVKEQTSTSKYWVIGTGSYEHQWDDYKSQGIISLDWDKLGDITSFNSRDEMKPLFDQLYPSETNQRNNTLACDQFVNKLRVGDFIFAKQGKRTILGIGEVVSDYIFDDKKANYKHVRKVKWLKTGEWQVDSDFVTKKFTDLTAYPDYVANLLNIIGIKKNLPTDEIIQIPTSEELFISDEKMRDIRSLLSYKKNIILQGPPGVGKTFFARRLAYALLGEKDLSAVTMVQFHQSYSYEDFIQGYRPSSDGTFYLKNGIFYNICERARKQPEKPFILIIDEINRGNLSKIFGELMLLIENDKRGQEYALQLTYSNEETDTFFVPENLFIIGTMNTADRSLAMVDYALRRRFSFVTLTPCFANEKFVAFLQSKQVSEKTIQKITRKLQELNSEIEKDVQLGSGFSIGHSYFCSYDAHVYTEEEWYNAVVESEIIPLLEEYWFDDNAKVVDMKAILTQ